MAQLFNTKVEGRYIFAGSDIGNQPFPECGQFFTDVETQVNAMPQRRARDLGRDHDDRHDNTYFSTALRRPIRPARPRGRPQSRHHLSGAANGPELPTPPAGQIEPFREILRSLATAADLTYDPNNPASFNDFQTMLTTTRTSLDGAAKLVDNHVGIFGSNAARMKALDTQHDETAVTLKKGVGDVEDVDMAETISKLQLVQTQLPGLVQGHRDLAEGQPDRLHLVPAASRSERVSFGGSAGSSPASDFPRNRRLPRSGGILRRPADLLGSRTEVPEPCSPIDSHNPGYGGSPVVQCG